MYKYDLHIHTAEGDIVANVSGAEIVKKYKELGYDGVVITDHYFSSFYKWFKDDINLDDKTSIIDRYLRGYYSALNEAEKIGFTVLCGAEVRFDGTPNDYLVYGLNPEDFYELPLLNRLKNVEELSNVLPDSALIVQAHPFRDKMTVCTPNHIFGIEGYNAGTPKFRNEMAKTFAKFYNKPIVSGTDFHCSPNFALGGITTDKKINNNKDFVEVLKSGNYSIIETFEKQWWQCENP